MTGAVDGPTQPTVSDLVDRLGEDVVRRLLGDVAARDEETARAVRLAAAGPSERLEALNSWTIEGRYPADLPESDRSMIEDSLAAARRVLDANTMGGA